MHSTNFWHKFDILGKKIIILCFVMIYAGNALAQIDEEVFNPRYDDRKIVTYGFSLGVHFTSYKLKYSDYFTTPAMDSVFSILPKRKPGFKLGFIVNFRLAQFLDVRITPTVAFAEYVLEYNYVGGDQYSELLESTGVEFPILVKYKSQRRNNARMYVVGGITPIIEAAGRSNLEEDLNRLQLQNFNANLELGFGFDLYYPLFKFSPEVRFAYGLVDILNPVKNDISAGIESLHTRSVSFYFHFQ